MAGQGTTQSLVGHPEGRREHQQAFDQGVGLMRTAFRKTGSGGQSGVRGARDLGWVAVELKKWAPHLPGPVLRTMCSSCPQASRGSPHPGVAWAAQPPCGRGRESREGSHQPPGPLR